MRKVVFSLCVVICVAACASPAWAQGGLDQRVSELSQQIANKMSAKQKTTVAVVEFTDLQGNVTDFGRFLAEELVTRLGDLEKFKVIERQLLNKIIAEQKLSLTGLVDPASAKQLGKILGVDAIVAGSVTNLAQSVRVNARLISTETGEVFATAAADIFKDESVMGLLSGSSSAPLAKSTTQQLDPKKNSRKITIRDFIIELESCRISAGAIVCSMTITNDASTDRTVGFHTRASSRSASRMLDEFGGEYGAAKVQIGGHVSQFYLIGPAVTSSLVPRVPTKLIITFDNVSPEAKTVTFLRVAFQWSDSNSVDLNADFRGIAITK
jgi:TolB-like protein